MSFRQAVMALLVGLLLGVVLSAFQIGWDLMRERRRRDQDILRLARLVEDERLDYLAKPFTPGTLAKKVREILDE